MIPAIEKWALRIRVNIPRFRSRPGFDIEQDPWFCEDFDDYSSPIKMPFGIFRNLSLKC